MKTRCTQGPLPFRLKIVPYGNFYYIKRVAKLERLLARKPRTVQIELVGMGEIPADSALLIRSVLLGRSEKTRLITNARSSLQGGSALVWLLGDSRRIRDDASVHFRRVELPDDWVVKPNETWKDSEPKYRDSFSDIDPEDGDYARVLELVNEYLPVKELAGRLIGLPVLRQFGLVENEEADHILAAAFQREKQTEAKPRSRLGTIVPQQPDIMI